MGMSPVWIDDGQFHSFRWHESAHSTIIILSGPDATILDTGALFYRHYQLGPLCQTALL